MITIVLCITALVAVIFGIFYTIRYKNLEREFYSYKKKINRKYIEVDVRLRNAIQEALESAIDKNNEFEEKAYKGLLREIHGKW